MSISIAWIQWLKNLVCLDYSITSWFHVTLSHVLRHKVAPLFASPPSLLLHLTSMKKFLYKHGPVYITGCIFLYLVRYVCTGQTRASVTSWRQREVGGLWRHSEWGSLVAGAAPGSDQLQGNGLRTPTCRLGLEIFVYDLLNYVHMLPKLV